MTTDTLYNLRYKAQTGHNGYSTSAKISPNGAYIATSSSDCTIRLFDLENASKLIRVLEGHRDGVNDISWSPDSRHLASVSDDMTLRVWDVEYGECISVMQGHTYHVTCVEFNHKGNLLVTGSSDEAIRLWDALNAKCLKTLSAHSDPIAAVDLCWDSTIIASASYDGMIRLFDTESGQCLKTLIYDKGGSSFPVSYVRFSPNGKYLLSTTLDNTLRLWDYMNNKVVKTFQGAKLEKYTCSSRFIMAKDPLIASGTETGDVLIWDLQSKGIIATLKVSTSPVLAIDVHNNTLIAMDIQGNLLCYDLNEGFSGYDSERTDTN